MLEPQQQMPECNLESLWAQRGTLTLHPDVALLSLTSSSYPARPIFQKSHLPPLGLYPEPERAAVLMEVFLPSQWEKCPGIQFSSSVQVYLPFAFQRC